MESSNGERGSQASQSSVITASTTCTTSQASRSIKALSDASIRTCKRGDQRHKSHQSLEKHPQYGHGNPRLKDTGTGTRAADGNPAGPQSSLLYKLNVDILDTNVAIVSANESGPHKCTRVRPSTNQPCNTTFSRLYDLIRHEETVHRDSEKSVKCLVCTREKTFSRNDALARHMRVVHPEVNYLGKHGSRKKGDP